MIVAKLCKTEATIRIVDSRVIPLPRLAIDLK